MATYKKSSPYSKTGVNGDYLDVMNNRKVSATASDQVLVINQTYQYRPDLLAHDLYDDSNLWWVFAARNPNQIKDPIWDMKAGVSIFLPEKTRLFNDLGL